jgi:hypothetical protein
MASTSKADQHCEVENLNDKFLCYRPPINDIFPEVFGNLDAKSIVSVFRKSQSGKSMFLMELVARAVTMVEDKNAEVLVLDIDGHFDVFKVLEMCMKYRPDLKEENADEVIKKMLSRVHTVDDEEIHNIDHVFYHLSQILTDYKNVSLVVIDSIGSNYYLTASNHLQDDKVSNINKDLYMKSYLEKLKVFVERFGVSFVFSKPIYMTSEKKDAISTHQVTLEKKNLKLYWLILIKAEGGLAKKVGFNIEEDGIKILEEGAAA